eukprot:CAMPEP_0113635392 /NCGR_PEP_ID=MMETSP0017_2-20120614/18451_1 /TAXON_ID=2856 /ORGANISM="Cylindrotheca closterium" /LENGTH=230 /DNA_ID=CAMNT_0000546175 /DNA_START=54 /DNA_END=746 /DNA_ORIENTATION=- /assembly_acc=CAM_ASM_000147
MSVPSKLKLTYFDIEGAAEPVRLAFTLAGIPFEDDRIKFPEWKELKPKTPYGKLPVLAIDGDMKTQSSAQLRYAASIDPTGTLYPKEKLYEIEECIGLIKDLQDSWTPRLYIGMRPATFGYPEDFTKTEEGKAKVEAVRKEWVEKEMPELLSYIEGKIVKNGGNFLCGGDKPTIADCVLVPLLRGFTKGHIDHVDTECIKKNSPKLVEYVERFCALPEIKGRYTSGIGSA